MNQFDQNDVQEKALSIGNWFVTILVMSIPLVGLIMLFVWGFGNGNKNRANFCKAMLIWAAVWIVLGIVFSTIFMGVLAGLAGGLSGGW